MRKGQKVRENYTPEEFVRAYQSSSSHAEVAKKLGMTTSGVASRACFYRRKGVPLRSYSRARKIDWEQLKELCESLQDE